MPHSQTVSFSDKLKSYILEQGLVSGDLLPPERTLAKELDMARNTLRRALAELEMEGIIHQEGRKRRIRGLRRQERPSLLSESAVVLSDLDFGSPHGKTLLREDNYILVKASELLEEQNISTLFLNHSRLRSDGCAMLHDASPRCIMVSINALEDAENAKALSFLYQQGIPVVLYGKSDVFPSWPSAYPDHEKNTYRLTRKMIDEGRRDILCAWLIPDSAKAPVWVRHRYNGYVRAMEEAGRAVREPLHTPPLPKRDMTSATYYEAVDIVVEHLGDTLKNNPTIDGLLSLGDGSAYILASACKALGRTPHEDILVTGYDNNYTDCIEAFMEKTSPALTVDKQNDILADSLAELAYRCMTTPVPWDNTQVPVDGKIITT